LVQVDIILSPLAAATRSFGVLLVCGDSNVISGLERFRTYGSITEVTQDFGTDTPEYNAAVLYFGQTPKPATIMIGRWLRTATAGQLTGGILNATQQLISNFTVVTAGGFKVTIDGVLKTLSGLDFSGAANLNAVAAIITTALSTSGSCVWNGSSFEIISATTGITSTVSDATSPATGTDITTLLKISSALALPLVPGYASETPVQCAAVFTDLSPAWYGLTFSASVFPTDQQNLDVCTFIEAQDLTRIFGVTITDTSVLSSEVTDDLASTMMAGGYKQSFNQYSANPYAINSFFGRAFSVNFAGNRTTITLMYKQEPSVVAEDFTSSQADVLEAKRCNVFTEYQNNTAIIQYGVMSGPAWFDETHGLDWFQDTVQTACFNLMFTSTTKIPQTDAGVNQFVNAISAACESAINNGLVAPGTWNADGFGQLQMGQYLQDGYYIYAQPIDQQSQADREARIAPPIQVAIKLAGAIQSLNVQVNVNR
jgi:hypothetical protein